MHRPHQHQQQSKRQQQGGAWTNHHHQTVDHQASHDNDNDEEDDDGFPPLLVQNHLPRNDHLDGSKDSSKKATRPSSSLTATVVALLLLLVVFCLQQWGFLATNTYNNQPYIPPHDKLPTNVIEINPGFGPIVMPPNNRLVPIRRSSSQQRTKEDEVDRSSTSILPLPSKEKYHDNDSIIHMLKNLQHARKYLEYDLRKKYGNYYYEQIFYEQTSAPNKNKFSRGRVLYQGIIHHKDDSKTWNYWIRKLQIKLLQSVKLSSSTSSSNNSKRRRPTLVWAVGGDSRAAPGYGNFANETITSFMELAAMPIFQAVGMDLQVRNRAMGGTSSGPEIAYCLEEIMGNDIDVLVWDYGLADTNVRTQQAAKLSLFFHRLLSQQPSVLGIAQRIGRHYYEPRKQALQELSHSHPNLMYMSEHVWDRVLQAFPDSYFTSTASAQVVDDELLPEYVRNLKCQGHVEGGRKLCEKDKFNCHVCKQRPYRSTWHYGWKQNAILGHMAALFLVESLSDALNGLMGEADLSLRLETLQKEEERDLKNVKPAIPQVLQTMVERYHPKVEKSALLQKRTYCHTARLPAEIRSRGILTETDSGVFDPGMNQTQADESPNMAATMRLVYSQKDRDYLEEYGNDDTCKNITLRADFSDYFYTRTEDDWKSMALPNDSEIREYGNPDEILHGYLAICFAACQYNKCPRRNLDREAFDEDLFEMQVNGQAVTELVPLLGLSGDCMLLQHAKGYRWTPNESGKFVFRVRVSEPKTFVRIGAFILW